MSNGAITTGYNNSQSQQVIKLSAEKCLKVRCNMARRVLAHGCVITLSECKVKHGTRGFDSVRRVERCPKWARLGDELRKLLVKGNSRID
jgi:hypothetical protein